MTTFAVLILVGIVLLVPVTAVIVARTLRDRDDVAAWRGGYHAGLMAADDLARGTRPLVNVRNVTTGSSGVRVEENHLLPVEVAARLYGEVDR